MDLDPRSPDTTRAVRVHDLAEARAALRAAALLGRGVTLVSPPGAGAQAGAAWFRELVRRAAAEHPGTNTTAILDCADHAGHALGALRAGVRHVLFTGRPDVAERLRAIAEAQGGTLHVARPPALDLRDAADPVERCRHWLAGTD